jgi:hypothetical protein
VSRDTIDTEDTGVTSYAYLFADTKLTTNLANGANGETFNTLGGEAGLDTGITGSTISTASADYNVFPNRQVFLAASPVQGQFTAGAFASGQAGYTATQAIVPASAASDLLYGVNGMVSGTVSLEATNTGKGIIAGAQGSGSTLEFNHDLTGPETKGAEAFMYANSNPTGSTTSSQFSQASSGISVAARRPIGFIGNTAGTSEIFGTAKGSVDAATHDASVTQVTSTSASVDTTMNADAKAYLPNDDAKAMSYISSKSSIGEYGTGIHDSRDLVFTEAYSKRTTTTTGTKTGAEAFITNAVWNAETDLLKEGADTSIVFNDKTGGTSLSGETGTISGLTGIGAGSFLLKSKNGPAFAEFKTGSNAQWDSADPIPTTGQTTSQTDVGNMVGPQPAGANTNDGTGIYAAILNRNQKTDYNTGGNTVAFVPKEISTSIGSEADLMWTDGTNSLAFNGPGFLTTGPVYVGGTGSTNGPTTSSGYSVLQRTVDTGFGTGLHP